MARDVDHYPVAPQGIITAAFLCYFLGLVVSRFGSLILEPLLRRASFIQFADYKDFVTASKKDDQLALLQETNNMYRTLSSLFCLLLALKLYMKIEVAFPILKYCDETALAVLLLALFLFSYRKQTTYITKRIKPTS